MRSTLKQCHGSPSRHEEWQPVFGSELLEKQVGWEVEEAEGYVEDNQRIGVLVSRHAEIFF